MVVAVEDAGKIVYRVADRRQGHPVNVYVGGQDEAFIPVARSVHKLLPVGDLADLEGAVGLSPAAGVLGGQVRCANEYQNQRHPDDMTGFTHFFTSQANHASCLIKSRFPKYSPSA